MEIRDQFAQVFAEAYIGRKSVMGQPVIYWSEKGFFGWTSSLTPLSEDERVVLVIEDGMCGYDTDPDEDVLKGYALADTTLWAAVLAALQEEEDE